MRENINKFAKNLYKKVYWAEFNGTGYIVKSGILLAMYKISHETYYVVSNGDITSCVVSHIKKYFLKKENAWISCSILGEEI